MGWTSSDTALVEGGATAGGWKPEETLQRCYQQPDEATMLNVGLNGVELRRSKARSAPPRTLSGTPSRSTGQSKEVKALLVAKYGVWRSPVARLLWEQEVPGSNPGAPM
jgi:hypothetical protein